MTQAKRGRHRGAELSAAMQTAQLVERLRRQFPELPDHEVERLAQGHALRLPGPGVPPAGAAAPLHAAPPPGYLARHRA